MSKREQDRAIAALMGYRLVRTPLDTGVARFRTETAERVQIFRPDGLVTLSACVGPGTSNGAKNDDEVWRDWGPTFHTWSGVGAIYDWLFPAGWSITLGAMQETELPERGFVVTVLEPDSGVPRLAVTEFGSEPWTALIAATLAAHGVTVGAP